jgi:eukaryotic-like serine/threonine-protein kinase
MYPQVFGKYVLERELARGGMARVVLATLRGAGGFEKKVVVKQIRDELACDDEFVARFVEEAKTTVTLAHPNIVTVYELGVELGTYYLAMEFVEGVSLAELLRATPQDPAAGDGRRGLSPEEGAYVGVEVCRALDYAHRRMNVVHRDVTPRNVMVDEEGHVKVIDFGIAAPVATAPSGHGVFGSPGHMPPEQVEASQLTPAADVFAVAVLLSELWSGKPPFRRATAAEVDAAMRAPHPRPSDADPRLLPVDDIIASAMALQPNARPQHAEDLSRALRRFLSGVDLGDVARQLGERVRLARARPAPAADERRPILQRPPSRPTATQVGTKTFAVRDELRAIEAAPPVAFESSTRRIESKRPPPADEGAAISTPRGEPTTDGAARRRGSSRAAVASLVVMGAVAAAASVALGRGARPPDTAPAVPVALAPAAPAAGPTSAPAEPLPAPAPSPRPPAGAPSSERAQLVLLGDGTLVTVDGTPRGACPARLVVDPGPHSIVFSFPATGESKSDALTLRAGDRMTLRADFTGVTPTIRTARF